MTTAMMLAALLCAQPKGEPGHEPLALGRSMEIDDLDREIRRLGDSVLYRRGVYQTRLRMNQRGLTSRLELEKATSDYRYAIAHQAELIAYRALKEYERDVLGGAAKADDAKAYSLLLEWLKKQEETQRVDLAFREFHMTQTQALFQRKLATREEFDSVALDFNTAQADVALNLSRQALVALEFARRDEKTRDAAEVARLRTEFVKARILYLEIRATGAKDRLLVATERSRRGLIPAAELALFQKNADQAAEALTAEQAKLHQAPDPAAGPADKNGG